MSKQFHLFEPPTDETYLNHFQEFDPIVAVFLVEVHDVYFSEQIDLVQFLEVVDQAHNQQTIRRVGTRDCHALDRAMNRRLQNSKTVLHAQLLDQLILIRARNDYAAYQEQHANDAM